MFEPIFEWLTLNLAHRTRPLIVCTAWVNGEPCELCVSWPSAPWRCGRGELQTKGYWEVTWNTWEPKCLIIFLLPTPFFRYLVFLFAKAGIFDPQLNGCGSKTNWYLFHPFQGWLPPHGLRSTFQVSFRCCPPSSGQQSSFRIWVRRAKRGGGVGPGVAVFCWSNQSDRAVGTWKPLQNMLTTFRSEFWRCRSKRGPSWKELCQRNRATQLVWCKLRAEAVEKKWKSWQSNDGNCAGVGPADVCRIMTHGPSIESSLPQ